MPRIARAIPPGEVVHVVSRFVNGEHKMSDALARQEYVRRLERSIQRTDWTVLNYALMSTLDS